MNIKHILRKILLFQSLKDENLDKIIKLGKFFRKRQGAIIFAENSSGNALYIVLKGVVKIFTHSASNNKKKTLAYLKEGEFFGEMSLIDLQPRCASAVALDECELMTIKKDDFKNLIMKNPQIALNIMKTLTLRLRSADKEIERISFHPLKRRISNIICELATKHSIKSSLGRKIVLKLSHQEIADLAGTSREMVSRHLKVLKQLGYIDIVNKKIVVKQLSQLRKLCDYMGG